MNTSQIRTGTLIWSGIQGTSLSLEEKNWIEKEHISAVILFKRNIRSLSQFYELCREIKSLKPPPLLVVDREGGPVDRLKHLPETPNWPSPEELTKVCSLKEIRKTAFYMGEELRTFGFSVNFAPVWDYLSLKNVPRLFRQRLLRGSPLILAQRALAFTTGLKRAGLPGVAKHFPGHGGVMEDSHLVLPVDLRFQKELSKDFSVFQKACEASVDLMMSAHILYPRLDQKNPATFSSAILRNLLREKMNFKGLVISDDLDMKALKNFDLKQKAVQFFQAGGDIILKSRFDEEVLFLPENIRQAISSKKLCFQEMGLKIKKVQAFKEKYQCKDIPPLVQWKDQVGKNSNSHLWCRKLNKRLNKL